MAQSKTVAEKLDDGAPYYIFYNKISTIPPTLQENCISFTDLLCPSLGKLKCSLHIAGKVDMDWLIAQYIIKNVEEKPLTILYGEEISLDEKNLESRSTKSEKKFDLKLCNVVQQTVPLKFKLNHHSKIIIFVYEDDSLRIVITTVNPTSNQWNNFNHGFWVSPSCPRLTDASSGESPTNFKSDLLAYLNHYNLEILKEFIGYVEKADFRDIKVCLVTSVPGCYSAENLGSHIQQVENLLKSHCKLTPDEKSWPLIAQASNMGQLGESPDIWLKPFFLNRLASDAKLQIIFPTWKQVKESSFAKIAEKDIRYNRATHNKQTWIEEYLHQWKADKLGRSKIMPHTKTYCQVSPCCSKMEWFLLTTGNINKGAWGQKYQPKGGQPRDEVYVRNYEVGVLFLPKFFGETYFKLKSDPEIQDDQKLFPLIYDVPLKKYTEKDYPWSSWRKN